MIVMVILIGKVHQTGMACHTGTYTCFTDRRLFPDSKDLVPMAQPQDNTSIAKVLNDLYATIKDRQVNPVEGSYTNYLFEKGQDKILKKVGEEMHRNYKLLLKIWIKKKFFMK